MDQELAVLMERMSRQIVESLRGEMTQQIGGLREEMTHQIGGLRGEMPQQIEGLREEMTQQMRELRQENREENRHTRVVVEGLRSDIQLIAEMLMDTRERFTHLEANVERRLEEMKPLISLPYRELSTRVSILEERFERQGRDAMEVLREKFGKPQA